MVNRGTKFSAVPNTRPDVEGGQQRYRRRKGEGNKKSTMRDIVSLLEGRSDALEMTFAAVSFDSLDVCALLARVEATKGEMEMMKTSFNLMTDTLAAQTSVCNDLRTAMQSGKAFSVFKKLMN